MDREAWHAAIHGVAKSRTWLSDWTELNWIFLYMDLYTVPFTRELWVQDSTLFILLSTRLGRKHDFNISFKNNAIKVSLLVFSVLCDKFLQVYPTLTPWTSLPGSSVHGILQARTLEWIAISSSRGSSQSRDQTSISDTSCVARWVLYH